MTTMQLVEFTISWMRATVHRVRADERGEVTEKVIIVAIFAALALAVGAIIVTKVTSKANAIPTQ